MIREAKIIKRIGDVALEFADNDPDKAQVLLDLTSLIHRRLWEKERIDNLYYFSLGLSTKVQSGLENNTKTKHW